MKFLFAIPALLLAVPVTAQMAPTVQPEAKPAKPAKAAEDRKICRADARTSTRLVKRTCRTAAEWKAIDQNTDGANNVVRNP